MSAVSQTPAGSLAVARLEVAAGVAPDRSKLAGRAVRALDLAVELGAPIGPVLEAAAAATADDEDRRRDLRVATAQAKLVASGLVGLPLVLVPGLDLLLGLPLLAFYGTAPGRVVLLVGAGLVFLGALASWRMVAVVGRGRTGAPDDEVADLLAAALASSLPASAALRHVGAQLPRHAPDLHAAALALEHGHDPSLTWPSRATPSWSARSALDAAIDLVSRADRLGVPAGEALRDLARDQRAEARADVRARAEQLPGKLAAPSVLLLLPATVLLVGAPVVALGLAGA